MGQVTRTNYGLVADLRLTNAQMLLAGTAITLVAARANTIWIPRHLVILSVIATAYATVANFFVGTTSDPDEWLTVTLAASGLDNVATNFVDLPAVSPGDQAVATFANAPIIFSGDVNPTGGASGNSVLLRLFYDEVYGTVPAA